MKKILLFYLSFILFSFSLGSDVAQSSNIVHLTKDNIASTAYKKPYLVLFYAPWCPFSKALRPIYEEFADLMDGKMLIADVDW